MNVTSALTYRLLCFCQLCAGAGLELTRRVIKHLQNFALPRTRTPSSHRLKRAKLASGSMLDFSINKFHFTVAHDVLRLGKRCQPA